MNFIQLKSLKIISHPLNTLSPVEQDALFTVPYAFQRKINILILWRMHSETYRTTYQAFALEARV